MSKNLGIGNEILDHMILNYYQQKSPTKLPQIISSELNKEGDMKQKQNAKHHDFRNHHVLVIIDHDFYVSAVQGSGILSSYKQFIPRLQGKNLVVRFHGTIISNLRSTSPVLVRPRRSQSKDTSSNHAMKTRM